MKFRRIISILVLVCFFTTQVVIKPKEVEAVVPVVPILVEAGISLLVSAGITYGVNSYLEHTARNEISKLSDAERRALQMEGGLSELTVDDFIKHGYKKPANFKKAYKIKGPAKAGLIGAVLTGIISGVPYVVDYMTGDSVEYSDDISVSLQDGYRVTERYCSGDRVYLYDPNKKYYKNTLPTKYIELHLSEGQYGYICYNYIMYGDNRCYIYRSRNGKVMGGDESSWIALEFDYEKNGRNYKGYWEGGSFSYYATTDTTYPIYINAYVEGEGSYTVKERTKLNNYTGTITPTVSDAPQVQVNRQRLQEVKDDPNKYVIVVEHTDGSVSLQTGTSVTTGTGTEENLPDPPPGEDDPIVPGEPEEGDKPDLNKLYGVVTTRWPFSLPWDIAHLINLVACEPIPPRWEFTLPEEFGEHTFVIDMAQYEDIMIIVRWFITFGFCFGIVLAIRKLYGGSV